MTRDNALSLKGERMLSVRETAKILGWCLDSVRRHLRAGDMPGVRIGRNWRVPESQLAVYMGLDPDKLVAVPEPPKPAPSPVTSRMGSLTAPLPPRVSHYSSTPTADLDPEYRSEIVETLLRTSAARTQVLHLVRSAMKNIDASPEIAQQTLREMSVLLQKL